MHDLCHSDNSAGSAVLSLTSCPQADSFTSVIFYILPLWVYRSYLGPCTDLVITSNPWTNLDFTWPPMTYILESVARARAVILSPISKGVLKHLWGFMFLIIFLVWAEFRFLPKISVWSILVDYLPAINPGTYTNNNNNRNIIHIFWFFHHQFPASASHLLELSPTRCIRRWPGLDSLSCFYWKQNLSFLKQIIVFFRDSHYQLLLLFWTSTNLNGRLIRFLPKPLETQQSNVILWTYFLLIISTAF